MESKRFIPAGPTRPGLWVLGIAVVLGAGCKFQSTSQDSSSLESEGPQSTANEASPDADARKPPARAKTGSGIVINEGDPPLADGWSLRPMAGDLLATGAASAAAHPQLGLGGADPANLATPKREFAVIKKAFVYATQKVKKEHPGLGRGWLGNVTGTGPKCNVVHDAYAPHVRNYLQKSGIEFRYYQPVTVFDAGCLPYDLAAHVYMGIGTVPESIMDEPDLVGWYDPWRYGNTETLYKPGTGPNGASKVIPQ